MDQDNYTLELETALMDLIGGFEACDIVAHFGNVQNLSIGRCEEIKSTLDKIYLKAEEEESANRKAE
jgi:hypothetical protein